MTRTQGISLLRIVSYVGIYGGLLMPLMFVPLVIFPFVFSKLIFFQILIGLTFPAYLVLAWIEPATRPQRHWLSLAIAAYFAALALSVVFAVDPARAWWGNQERMNGLFTLLHFLAWFVMTTSLLKTWMQWRRFLNYEIFLSLIMAGFALYQKIDPNILLFPAGDRVGGLLDNPIYQGVYQMFNLFFLAMLFLRVPSKPWRIWYGVVAVFDVWAFFEAQSRGELFGLLAGLAVFAAMFALTSKNARMRLGAILGGLSLFVGYGILFLFRSSAPVLHSPFGRLVNISLSVSTRLMAWKIAWQGFLERPITGWGLDNFHILFNQKYNPFSLRYGIYETWFDRSHNSVLDVLSMTGMLGFITYFAIFAALFYTVWRAWKRGWMDGPLVALLVALPIGYFVQNLFVFDHPAGFSMSFLLYALAVAATRPDFLGAVQNATPAQPAVARVTAASTRAVPWTTFVIMECLAALLVWRTSALPFQASQASIIANNAYAAHNLDAMLAYATQAADIWTPYLDEQTFLLARNLIELQGSNALTVYPRWKELYDLTKKVNEEELLRHPRNTHTLYIYARFLQSMAAAIPSDGAEAERVYKLAIDTSPKRQQTFYGLAQLYTDEHRLNDLLDVYRQIVAFDPDYGESHWNYGLTLYYNKGDEHQGAQEIVKAATAAYPYPFHDARELIPLADSYIQLNDIKGLQNVAAILKARFADIGHTQNPGAVYAELAYKFQVKGLPEQRDQILALGRQLDPNVSTTYAEVLKTRGEHGNGLTSPAAMNAAASAPPDAAANPSEATPLATTTLSGRGPRK